MARKSRKNLNNAPTHQVTQPEYVVGGYVRISVNNDTSIDNQEAVIQEYLNRHPEMQLHKFYADAGISSFAEDRPLFEAMIKDAELKRINCIIIKDLSRFGRDYIETCDYLEQILPTWGIRVISILDDYDSKGIYGSTDFHAALKSIINYSYSRDISIKVKSVVKMKQQKGTYMPARLPFGYRKGSTDGRTCFEIDPASAQIVRYIFQLAANGASAFEIAGILNQDKVAPPGLSIPKGETALSALWARNAVSRILRDETYTGCFLTGKTENTFWPRHHTIRKPKKEWTLIPNHHAAIIDDISFYKAQKMLRTRRSYSIGQKHVQYPDRYLGNVLCCGTCGRKMKRRIWKGKIYYTCPRSMEAPNACSRNSISEDTLKKDVYETIQLEIEKARVYQETKSRYEQSMAFKVKHQCIERRLAKLQSEIMLIGDREVAFYTEKADGYYSSSDYQTFKRVSNYRKALLSDEACCWSNLNKEYDEQLASDNPSIQALLRYADADDLTEEMYTALVKTIRCYEGRKTEVELYSTCSANYE